MTKLELVSALADEVGMTKKAAGEVVDVVLQKIATALSKGDSVTFTGFGTFKVKERAAREGINPVTKLKMKIPATKAVSFKAGKTLKDLVKGN